MNKRKKETYLSDTAIKHRKADETVNNLSNIEKYFRTAKNSKRNT